VQSLVLSVDLSPGLSLSGDVKRLSTSTPKRWYKPPKEMKNFTTYLSTAPVVALIWFTFTAGLLIEINRFFPDPLVFSF
jgi:photosystem I subunit 9